MAKKLYVEVGGKTRKAKKGYASVDGKARKIKKAYVGVDGKARAFWSGGELRYYGTATALSVGRYKLAATSVGNYALFGGGDEKNKSKTVDAYNQNLTRTTPSGLKYSGLHIAESIGNYAVFITNANSTTLGTVKDYMAAYDKSLTLIDNTYYQKVKGATYKAISTIGNYALIAGGLTKTAQPRSTVYTCNTSLTIGDADNLSEARCNFCGGKVRGYALFAGGSNGLITFYSVVDAYNSALTRTRAENLSYVNGGDLYTANAGEYALFAGDDTPVNAYSTSLTRSIPDSLYTTHNMAATTIGNYAIFAGTKGVEAYDTSLTRQTVTSLSVSRNLGAAATVGSYALFGGGLPSGGGGYSSAVDVYTID